MSKFDDEHAAEKIGGIMHEALMMAVLRNAEISYRMILAREGAGLSQGQVMRFVGMKALMDYEAQAQVWRLDRLLALVSIYGADLIWVITGHNPSFDRAAMAKAIGIEDEGNGAMTLTLLEMMGVQT